MLSTVSGNVRNHNRGFWMFSSSDIRRELWFWQLISDWMTPTGGVLGRSDREDLPGQTQNIPEGLCISPGLGRPRDLCPEHLFSLQCFYFPVKLQLDFNLSVTCGSQQQETSGFESTDVNDGRMEINWISNINWNTITVTARRLRLMSKSRDYLFFKPSSKLSN